MVSLWLPLGWPWLPLGCDWAPFGVPLRALGLPLAPFGVALAPFGCHWPPFGAPLEKPKKTTCFSVFSISRMVRGWSADGSRMVRGWSAGGPGKDNLDPVEDVLNENPSHVALGKLTQRTRERRAGGRVPFDSLCPLAILGHPLAPFGVPSGSLWPSFGVPLAIVEPKGPALGPLRKT